MHSIRKMDLNYKNKDSLKIFHFYTSEIKNNKKKKRKTNNINILSGLAPSYKKLTDTDLSKELPFFPPKRKKRSKRLSK